MTPERAFPDSHGIARTQIGVNDERGAADLQGPDLGKLPVEQILIRNVQEPDDDSAPHRGGAAFGSPSKKDVAREEGEVGDEGPPASAGPVFSERQIKRNPRSVQASSQYLFGSTIRVRHEPWKVRQGEPEQVRRVVIRLPPKKRHEPSIEAGGSRPTSPEAPSGAAAESSAEDRGLF